MEIYRVHGLQDLSVLPKFMYRFNARYSVDKDELTLNFYGKANYIDELKVFWPGRVTWEESLYPMSTCTIWRRCGTGGGRDTEINKTEQRGQKSTTIQSISSRYVEKLTNQDYGQKKKKAGQVYRQQLTYEEVEMTNRFMIRCSHSSVIRTYKLKTRCHLIPVRLAFI